MLACCLLSIKLSMKIDFSTLNVYIVINGYNSMCNVYTMRIARINNVQLRREVRERTERRVNSV